MILCVTLNPCLDKTLVVPAWQPGDSVRGRSMREVVGGKGNNVARALSRMGRYARPVTFLGGAIGDHCEALLRDDDRLEPLVTHTGASTRVILTVRTENSTHQSAFFDPDPSILPAEAESLARGVDLALSAGTVEALTLSGSSPSAATHGLYGDLIALARSRRVPVFLDTYGPALEAIWGFWPDAIQLNRREALAHLQKPTATDAEILTLLDGWARRGVSCAMVTNGPGPVLINWRGESFEARPPEIEAVNPIGSGDSLLAGLTDAWLANRDPEATFRHALACSVANALVWDAGAIDPGTVERMTEQIEVKPIVR